MHKIFRLVLPFITVFILFFLIACKAEAHSPKQPTPTHKKAILLVAFGTSYENAREPYVLMEKAVKQKYPDVEVRFAYTAKKIRQKAAKTQNIHWVSPAAALARLQDEGYTHVAVQSLHIIAGFEFQDLKRQVQAFSHIKLGLQKISLGGPLLSNTDDINRLATALLQYNVRNKPADAAVIWVGHGTHHSAGQSYPALAYALQEKNPRYMVTALEGYPDFSHTLKKLKKLQIKKAYVFPLMVVAGDHAQNDIAGKEEESVASQLQANGIQAMAQLTPVSMIPRVQEMFMEHLDQAYQKLQ